MSSWLKNLMKDSLVYGIGFGISRFLQIIVLPIVAHALSVSEFGYYSNYLIFYTFAGGVFVLGLDSAVARFIYDSDDKNYHGKLFSTGFFCLLIVSVLFATACSIYPATLLKIINVPAGYKKVLPYVLFISPCISLNNYFLSWFKWKRQKYFFLTNTIGTVFFLLMPLLIAKSISFSYIFQTIFFGQLIVVIISALLARNYIRFVFDLRLLGTLLKYGFPWMLVYFLGLSRTYLDRFFLTRYLDEDSYGIYNFSVRLSALLSLIITAFDMSFGPLAFSIWDKEGAANFFAKLQSVYVFLISNIACLIVIISPILVTILGGGKFAGAENVLPYLLFAAIPLSLINFSGLGIVYAKKSFLSTITLVIGFAAVLLLNAILTPRYLEFGAVNASLIGHILIVISGYWLSHRFYKISYNFIKDSLMFLFFLMLSISANQFQFAENIYQDILFKAFLLAVIALITLMTFFQTECKKLMLLFRNLIYARMRSNAVTNISEM